MTPSSSSTSRAEPAEAHTCQLLLSVGLLVSTLLIFELTPLDIGFQDLFFDFESGRWWVDASAPVPKALFYIGPKALLILLGLGMITLFLGAVLAAEFIKDKKGFFTMKDVLNL